MVAFNSNAYSVPDGVRGRTVDLPKVSLSEVQIFSEGKASCLSSVEPRSRQSDVSRPVTGAGHHRSRHSAAHASGPPSCWVCRVNMSGNVHYRSTRGSVQLLPQEVADGHLHPRWPPSIGSADTWSR